MLTRGSGRGSGWDSESTGGGDSAYRMADPPSNLESSVHDSSSLYVSTSSCCCSMTISPSRSSDSFWGLLGEASKVAICLVWSTKACMDVVISFWYWVVLCCELYQCFFPFGLLLLRLKVLRLEGIIVVTPRKVLMIFSSLSVDIIWTINRIMIFSIPLACLRWLISLWGLLIIKIHRLEKKKK